jgi:hypothetical protein
MTTALRRRWYDHVDNIFADDNRMAWHHLFKAQTYREHAKARFGLQLPLFDEDDGGIALEA